MSAQFLGGGGPGIQLSGYEGWQFTAGGGVGDLMGRHAPDSSLSARAYPGGHGLSGKHCPSSFMLKPSGHTPFMGAHLGNDGS